MKLLIDENLSVGLAKALSEWFTQIHHVRELHLQLDAEIWEYAKLNGFAIVSKDNDFLFLSLMYGCPPKIIGLKCGNRSTAYIIQLIISHFEVLENFELEVDSCYLEIA